MSSVAVQLADAVAAAIVAGQGGLPLAVTVRRNWVARDDLIDLGAVVVDVSPISRETLDGSRAGFAYEYDVGVFVRKRLAAESEESEHDSMCELACAVSDLIAAAAFADVAWSTLRGVSVEKLTDVFAVETRLEYRSTIVATFRTSADGGET